MPYADGEGNFMSLGGEPDWEERTRNWALKARRAVSFQRANIYTPNLCSAFPDLGGQEHTVLTSVGRTRCFVVLGIERRA